MKEKANCLPPGWAGFDVSSAVFDVALWGDQDFRDMTMTRFPRTFAGAEALVTWVEQQPRPLEGIVMEVTGSYSRELVEWILQIRSNWRLAIINPTLVKNFGKSKGLRNKTDQVDARLNAAFGHERKPPGWVAPDPALDELKSIFRTQGKLKAFLTSLRVRRKGCRNQAEVSERAQAVVIEALENQIQELDQAAKALMQNHASMAPDLELAMTVDGVGPVVATAILAEAGNLRRFQRGRQLTAFLGLSPKRNESGTSVKGKTRMCKVGGKYVRPPLYMAAVALTRRGGPLGDFYRRLVAAGKPKKAALGALMRKLVLVVRAVIIQGKPYRRIYPEMPESGRNKSTDQMARPA